MYKYESKTHPISFTIFMILLPLVKAESKQCTIVYSVESCCVSAPCYRQMIKVRQAYVAVFCCCQSVPGQVRSGHPATFMTIDC